ncbi:MAG: DNA replication/repair protein RecF [Gammaproteobacteria bacterium]|nr:DNA replication/repair protein RecF [Gammaproteobacteria bacterium]
MKLPASAPVITEVQLGSFRCFESANLAPGAGFNLISGGNASGKTSLLEALYFLGRGTSFRTSRSEAAIRFDDDRCTLFARLGVGLTNRVGLEVSRSEGLSIRVDGSPGTRADLARALPIQVLDPASHELVSGPPAGRRQFLDWGVFHVEHAFLPAWQRYRRALQQRNAALRSRSGAAAWHWDEGLIADGETVDACRRRVLALLQPGIQAASDRLLGADVELSYQPGWGADTGSLAEALASSRERDLQMATSTVGPHRADFRISVRTRRARDTVSRGQEKLVAAALTLAQVELVARSREQTVVLLLDEPGADLDRAHLVRLLGAVADAPVQSFVTSLDPGGVTLPAGARAFHVEHAEVRILL